MFTTTSYINKYITISEENNIFEQVNNSKDTESIKKIIRNTIDKPNKVIEEIKEYLNSINCDKNSRVVKKLARLFTSYIEKVINSVIITDFNEEDKQNALQLLQFISSNVYSNINLKFNAKTKNKTALLIEKLQ
jgi:hypothetical protein